MPRTSPQRSRRRQKSCSSFTTPPPPSRSRAARHRRLQATSVSVAGASRRRPGSGRAHRSPRRRAAPSPRAPPPSPRGPRPAPRVTGPQRHREQWRVAPLGLLQRPEQRRVAARRRPDVDHQDRPVGRDRAPGCPSWLHGPPVPGPRQGSLTQAVRRRGGMRPPSPGSAPACIPETCSSTASSAIHESLRRVVDGLTPDQLAHRTAPEANPIGWLAWHLVRVQDDHVADVAGREQVWTADGWADRFGLAARGRRHRVRLRLRRGRPACGCGPRTSCSDYARRRARPHGRVPRAVVEADDLHRVVDDVVGPAGDPRRPAGERALRRPAARRDRRPTCAGCSTRADPSAGGRCGGTTRAASSASSGSGSARQPLHVGLDLDQAVRGDEPGAGQPLGRQPDDAGHGEAGHPGRRCPPRHLGRRLARQRLLVQGPLPRDGEDRAVQRLGQPDEVADQPRPGDDARAEHRQRARRRPAGAAGAADLRRVGAQIAAEHGGVPGEGGVELGDLLGVAPFCGPNTAAAPSGPISGLVTSDATTNSMPASRGSSSDDVHPVEPGQRSSAGRQLGAVGVQQPDAERLQHARRRRRWWRCRRCPARSARPRRRAPPGAARRPRAWSPSWGPAARAAPAPPPWRARPRPSSRRGRQSRRPAGRRGRSPARCAAR